MACELENLQQANIVLDETYLKERNKHIHITEYQREKLVYLAIKTQAQLIKNCSKIEEIKHGLQSKTFESNVK